METAVVPSLVSARSLSHFFAPVASSVRAFVRSLAGRARRKRKTLSVSATAALGDRRFVSVIQFERQRFLIGSSPSSVTLLSQLPDEIASIDENRKNARETN